MNGKLQSAVLSSLLVLCAAVPTRAVEPPVANSASAKPATCAGDPACATAPACAKSPACATDPAQSEAPSNAAAVEQGRPPLPMAVALDAERMADGGVHLVVTVRVSGGLDSEVLLRVELPCGAALVAGEVEENLGWVQPDTVVTREFILLPGQESVRVVASSVGPAMGATAWAYWPEAPAQPAIEAPQFQPVAPVKFKGIPIDKAVLIH